MESIKDKIEDHTLDEKDNSNIVINTMKSS